MEPYTYPADCFFKSLEDIKGKKITIMGLGLNGGGQAAVRFFLKHGAFLTVTDMKTEEELSPTLRALEKDIQKYRDNITFVLGRHDIQDFSQADVVIKNPGVKIQGNKYLAAAKAIETDISVFLKFTQAPIIAVTGSKGKSSTVSAIHYGLQNAGFKTFLGGNITVSPLTFLEETDKNTPVVLELSSWQLADLRGRGLLKPFIALLTLIVPDHQNWYGSMESYVADKKLIYKDQDCRQWTVCGTDYWGSVFVSETKAQKLFYDTKPLPPQSYGAFFDGDTGYLFLPSYKKPQPVIESLVVPGKHMRINALNAALVMALMGIEPTKISSILSQWPGLPHRLEFFHKATLHDQQICFYNDSAATVPEATVAAVEAFHSQLHLICGGTDKNLDFLPLASALEKNPPFSVCLLEGTGTDKLIKILKEKNILYYGPFPSLQDLLEHLKTSILPSVPEDQKSTPVVFSPGATSFGMFKNEFDRGNTFKAEVLSLF